MKSPKAPLLPFRPKPTRRASTSRLGGSQPSNGNRWEQQSRQHTGRTQPRISGSSRAATAMTNSRASDGTSQQSGDLDLVSALSARAAAIPNGAGEVPRGSAATAGSRSASRSGGRIRMDAPMSVRTGPRAKAIPSAPRYRPNARPVNWRAIFLVTLCTLVVSYGLTYLFTSPTLALTNVEINGVSPATAQLLQADLPGDPFGVNLLRYTIANHRIIRRHISNAEADFASVHVGIHLPHTLVIDIVKRTPVVMLSANGQTLALDDRGIPIRQGTDPQVSALNLPRLEVDSAAGAALPPPVLGQALQPSLGDSVRDGYAVLKALRRQSGLSNVGSIRIDTLQNVSLLLPDNLLIKLGQPIDIDTKLALADTLMQQHPDVAAQASYIDVSYPARPAMLPKGASTAPPPTSDAGGSTSPSGASTLQP